jgi:hypothetical protein
MSKPLLVLLLALTSSAAFFFWYTQIPRSVQKPLVLWDRNTGLYHTGMCPKRGSDVVPMPVVEASEKHRACPVCCPLCAMLGDSREGLAAAAFAAEPMAEAPAAAGGAVQVKGYRRKDGTYVRPHTRKK